MAELKVKDILNYYFLEDILKNKYNEITIQTINKESKLPIWFIKELKECTSENEFYIALKIAIFCMRSGRFIKNSLNQKSNYRRNKLINNRDKSKIEIWLNTYLSNQTGKIYAKKVYQELCIFFPNYEKSGHSGYKKIQKIIKKFRNKKYYNKRLSSDFKKV